MRWLILKCNLSFDRNTWRTFIRVSNIVTISIGFCVYFSIEFTHSNDIFIVFVQEMESKIQNRQVCILRIEYTIKCGARGKVINAYINIQHRNEWTKMKMKKKKKSNFNVQLSVLFECYSCWHDDVLVFYVLYYIVRSFVNFTMIVHC